MAPISVWVTVAVALPVVLAALAAARAYYKRQVSNLTIESNERLIASLQAERELDKETIASQRETISEQNLAVVDLQRRMFDLEMQNKHLLELHDHTAALTALTEIAIKTWGGVQEISRTVNWEGAGGDATGGK